VSDVSRAAKATRARRAGRTRAGGRAVLDDRLAVSADLIRLIWQHKLWWVVPLVLALVVVGALLALEATPIGPLLYPVF
jgi:hypothetical protein